MIKILTNCSACTNIVGRSVSGMVTGSLLTVALCADFKVPQIVYQQIYEDLRPGAGPIVQLPYAPPEWLSFTSSGHADLFGSVRGGSV